jgi:hypothetical protein
VTQQDQQVAAAAIVGDGRWLGRLQDELRGLLAPVFCQARSRLAGLAYIGALVAVPGDRKSCWQLAEAAGHATLRTARATPCDDSDQLMRAADLRPDLPQRQAPGPQPQRQLPLRLLHRQTRTHPQPPQLIENLLDSPSVALTG